MTNQLSPKMHHGHTWIGAKNGHYQGKEKEGERKEKIEKKWKQLGGFKTKKKRTKDKQNGLNTKI